MLHTYINLTIYFMITPYGAFEILKYVFENIMENNAFAPISINIMENLAFVPS